MSVYAIARNLVGFSSSSLRVKVNQVEGTYARVTTADLRDAGTRLVLDVAQIEYEQPEYVLVRTDGTVGFFGPLTDAERKAEQALVEAAEFEHYAMLDRMGIY